MSKFKTSLTASDSEIKAARATRVETLAKMACNAQVSTKTKNVINIEDRISVLSDFGGETTTTLRPVSADFDADKWAESLNVANCQLAIAKVELTVAEGVVTEWFGKETAEDTAE